MCIKWGNEAGRGIPGDSEVLAAELSGQVQGNTPAGLPGRIERYAAAHKRAVEMARYVVELAVGQGTCWSGRWLHRLAEKLLKCGDYLVFRMYPRIDRVRLHAAQFCHVHHLCPLCAICRGAKLLRLYLARFELLLMEYPKASGYFVTLTVKDGADLLERFGHLSSNMQRLIARRRDHQSGFVGSQLVGVLGGVGAYEFKRGSGSGLWHPHYHAVWLSEKSIDAAAISEEWRGLTGDSFIVDVRPLYGESAQLGFLECFKYAVKFSDLPLADNYEAYRLLARRRLVSSFGVFRGIDVSRLDDDPVSEDEPFIELFYRYRHGSGYSFDPVRSKPLQDPNPCLNQEKAPIGEESPVSASAEVPGSTISA